MSKNDIPASNCHNCRFSGIDSGGKGTVCRKKPPIPVVGMQMNMLTQKPEQGMFALWPPVTENDWCGEWSAKLSS